MNVTPTFPYEYNGPIKQLTRRVCKQLFYITGQITKGCPKQALDPNFAPSSGGMPG